LTAIRQYGLEFYMVCDFPTSERPTFSENLLATNWPEELVALYSKTDMLRESRIIGELRRSILPVQTEALLYASAQGVMCELRSVYVDEGFRDTLAVSLYDANRKHYCLVISGPKAIELQAIGTMLIELMRALDEYTATFSRRQEILTIREIECLRWSAAGKSSEEMAIILDLSAHTVNDYVKNAMRKLNTVSRIQAVAAAVRLGLI
jgi:DNA-binding CsgD family transcriptional regulator